jgi:hypothetical protein
LLLWVLLLLLHLLLLFVLWVLLPLPVRLSVCR